MDKATTMTIDDVLLLVFRCDWRGGTFECRTWVRPESSTLQPLQEAMTRGQLKTCHLRPSRYDSRLSIPLSFGAYVTQWACLARSAELPGLQEYAITLTMSGPPWREDDTPVESHEALWDLMMPAYAERKI